MFVDKVQATFEAGHGGDGYVSFRHEKFVDRGGPDGGDGGHGGDIILVASRNENTLADFRFQKHLKADDGKPGFKTNKHGRSGEDMLVSLPVGTVVFGKDGEVLADLVEDGQKEVIAQGGRGGYGNAHFKSSTRQAPRVAEKGERGELLEVTLELKMIADVGLVGLPNAGKSTLLSVVSNAKPEIANYPFTTLRPNLGMAKVGETELLIADIPGLIEGASTGKGLGDEFLRHVERTLVLVHMIDAWQNEPVQAYKTIEEELAAYSKGLAKRPRVVVLTKTDGLDEDIVTDIQKTIQKVVPAKTPFFTISAHTHEGVDELLYGIKDIVSKERKKIKKENDEAVPVIRLVPKEDVWSIALEDGRYIITGRKIERFAMRTHFDDFHGRQRLRDILRKMGIMKELEKRGIEPGAVIQFGEPGIGELEY